MFMYPGVPQAQVQQAARPLASLGPSSRVLVTGSRDWEDQAAVRTALTAAWRAAGQPLIVVHGACPTGVDAFADEWAVEHGFAGIEVERHPADWSVGGRSAGPLRNQAMVAAGAWRVLAFVRHHSPGATGCVLAARRAGLDVHCWTA